MKTILIAIVLAIGLVASTAAHSASGKLYVSKRFGYTLRLTGAWTANPIPGRWDGRLGDGVPGTDTFIELNHSIRVLIVATSAKNLTLSRWTARFEHALPNGCARAADPQRTTLAGAAAERLRIHCPDGYDGEHLTLMHKHRAVGIGAVWQASAVSGRDAAIVQRLLASLRFSS